MKNLHRGKRFKHCFFKGHWLGLLICAAIFSPIVSLHAQTNPPVQFASNGHHYQVVSQVLSWADAKLAAEVPYLGMTGHLVTITSQAENDFILNLLPSDAKSALTGGTDEDLEGVWTWVTGEPFSYTNWLPSEPNNQGGNENYLHFNGGFWGPPQEGGWNDGHGTPSLGAPYYVIEWDTDPVTPVLNPANSNYYLVVTTAVNISWADAKLDAEITYMNMTGYLATVTSENENDFIKNLLGPDTINVHLGGSDENIDGHWEWITGEPFLYTNWYTGEPNNHGGNEDFLVMNGAIFGDPQRGTWNDSNGAAGHGNKYYVIEWGEPILNEEPLVPIQNIANGHYYMVLTGLVSWTQAKTIAENLEFNGLDGYLATVENQQENDFILSLLPNGAKTAMIGGTDDGDEGNWRWITGEPWNFENWYTNEPNNEFGNENYLYLLGNFWATNQQGFWNDGHNGPNPNDLFYVVEWGDYSLPPTATNQIVQFATNGHYYLVVSQALTWAEAKIAAEVPYLGMTGHLVTITSEAENDFILNLLPADAKAALTGGTDEGHEGIWTWVTGEPFTYTNWLPTEPNNQGGNENYLHFNGGFWGPPQEGGWNDGHGTVSLDAPYYIIEWGIDSNAHSGPVFNPENNHYYQVVKGQISWADAFLAAQIEFNGNTGYLATVTSAQENQFIQNLLGVDEINIHLGGTDDGDEGNWRWITGEPFSYENWWTNEPNNQGGAENFLVMNGNIFGMPQAGTWNDGRGLNYSGNNAYVIEWGDFNSVTNINSPQLNPANGHYYLVVSNTISWVQALNAAQQPFNGMTGYLATITSSQENSFVLGLLPPGTKSASIGGTDEGDEGNWRWITGEPFSFTHWHTGEPNNQFGNENYLYFNGPFWGPPQSGTWNDGHNGPNSNDKFYVIEWGGGYSTQPYSIEKKYNPENGHWYAVVPQSGNWSFSRLAAQIEYEGITGHLATVTSESENQFIANLLPTNARNVAIGGTDEVTDGEWKWITGEIFDYTDWYLGEPNNFGGPENYLYMAGPVLGANQLGSWNDGRDRAHPDNNYYVIEWDFLTETNSLLNPVFNPENGHYYLVVTNRVSWWQALKKSQIKYAGTIGHLVTLTSSNEADFVYSLLGSDAKKIHLGGTDELTEGSWQWITGESWNFTDWTSGSDDSNNHKKDYLFLKQTEGVTLGWEAGNGAPKSGYKHFIIEWDSYDTLQAYKDIIREDSDGDGVTDVDENIYGTNPLDFESIFSGDLSLEGSHVRVSWKTVYGKRYTVQCRIQSTNENWTVLAPEITELDEYPEGQESFLHINALVNEDKCQYRIIELRD